MLKLLFVLSVTAVLFLILLGLIRSKVQPKSTMRQRIESLETLDAQPEPLHGQAQHRPRRKSRQAASSRCSARWRRP